MGLDLYCGDVSVRVGSYSTVHVIRNFMIKLLVFWLAHGSHNLSSENVQRLTELFQEMVRNDYDVDYVYIEKNLQTLTREFTRLGWLGLFNWIFHSDCDGTFSSDDSKEVLSFLEASFSTITIENFPQFFNDKLNWVMDESFNTRETFLAAENRHTHFYLFEIFHCSSTSGEDIVFA